jgi:uncharacterized protein YecE (DUF72 family)
MAGLDSKDVLVGAGGWLEYKKDKVPLEMRLGAYSNEFDFVEVNSTFYQILQPQTVERWRKSVPADFEFSMKCYEALTHRVGLRPVEDAFRIFGMMQSYCEILNSKILVMQMPPSLKLDEKFINQARDFFKSLDLGSLRVAFEFRVTPEKMPGSLLSMLRDFNMAHTVDLTFEEPIFESDLLYSRIFGQPKKGNNLDSKDLNEIKKKVGETKSKTVYIIGHSKRTIHDTRKIREVLAV